VHVEQANEHQLSRAHGSQQLGAAECGDEDFLVEHQTERAPKPEAARGCMLLISCLVMSFVSAMYWNRCELISCVTEARVVLPEDHASQSVVLMTATRPLPSQPPASFSDASWEQLAAVCNSRYAAAHGYQFVHCSVGEAAADGCTDRPAWCKLIALFSQLVQQSAAIGTREPSSIVMLLEADMVVDHPTVSMQSLWQHTPPHRTIESEQLFSEQSFSEATEIKTDRQEIDTDSQEVILDQHEISKDAKEIAHDEDKRTGSRVNSDEIVADRQEVVADQQEIGIDEKEIQTDRAEILADQTEIDHSESEQFISQCDARCLEQRQSATMLASVGRHGVLMLWRSGHVNRALRLLSSWWNMPVHEDETGSLERSVIQSLWQQHQRQVQLLAEHPDGFVQRLPAGNAERKKVMLQLAQGTFGLTLDTFQLEYSILVGQQQHTEISGQQMRVLEHRLVEWNDL